MILSINTNPTATQLLKQMPSGRANGKIALLLPEGRKRKAEKVFQRRTWAGQESQKVKKKEKKGKDNKKQYKKKNNVGFTILSFVTDLLAEAVYLTASDAVGRGGGKYAQYPCRPVLLVYRKIKSGTGLGLASPVFDDRLVSLLSLHLQFLLLVQYPSLIPLLRSLSLFSLFESAPSQFLSLPLSVEFVVVCCCSFYSAGCDRWLFPDSSSVLPSFFPRIESIPTSTPTTIQLLTIYGLVPTHHSFSLVLRPLVRVRPVKPLAP